MFQGTALNVVRVSIEKPEAVAHSQTARASAVPKAFKRAALHFKT